MTFLSSMSICKLLDLLRALVNNESSGKLLLANMLTCLNISRICIWRKSASYIIYFMRLFEVLIVFCIKSLWWTKSGIVLLLSESLSPHIFLKYSPWCRESCITLMSGHRMRSRAVGYCNSSCYCWNVEMRQVKYPLHPLKSRHIKFKS